MSKSQKKTGIVICGAYGLGNIGDEAILKAILRQMRQIAPDAQITVLSRNPRETAQRHQVRSVHMVDLPRVWGAMRRAAIYVNGGGTLIQDVTSRRSLCYYLYTLRWAKKRGCRVLMYGCGIGPVNDSRDVELTRKILNSCVDVITLREPDSMEELRRMGVDKPRVLLTADPALTLRPADDEAVDRLFARAGIPTQGDYLCFALRKWAGFEEKAPIFTAAAQYAYEKYGLTPVFAAVEHRQDPEAGRLAARGLSVPHYFLDNAGDVETLIGALARMKALVSMRLHALIFASGQGVPLVGVVYDPKVRSFLSYLGQDLYTDLADLTEDSLKAMIDAAALRMGDHQAQVEKIQSLLWAEHQNQETAAALLAEKEAEER